MRKHDARQSFRRTWSEWSQSVSIVLYVTGMKSRGQAKKIRTLIYKDFTLFLAGALAGVLAPLLAGVFAAFTAVSSETLATFLALEEVALVSTAGILAAVLIFEVTVRRLLGRAAGEPAKELGAKSAGGKSIAGALSRLPKALVDFWTSTVELEVSSSFSEALEAADEITMASFENL